MWRKISSILISLCLAFQQLGFASIATELNLAGHLSKMPSAFTPDRFRPVHIRFFSYDALKDNIKVMLDKGDVKNLNENQINESTQELLNYFLVGVSLPNNKFWVNLRPDSETDIIDNWLAKTDLGKIMLEADLQLKKDTAQFTSPETPEGRLYWNKLYQKAGELYGNQEVSIPTLTRPWIVPNEIIIRETKDSAYIYKATLKVMLEQDFLKDSSVYNFKDARAKALNEYSSQLIRELIIPKLTKEVNLSKRYAALRQVYYSIILSRWFKSRFANQTGLYTSRIDRKDLSGLISTTEWSTTSYFEAYKKSFAQGEYNIKEAVNTPTGQTIRSYFSGGMDFATMAINGTNTTSSPISTALMKAGLITPSIMTETVSSPIRVSGPNDLISIIKSKKIKSAILALDWNVSVKAGQIIENERIVNSLDTINWGFNEGGLQFMYVLTHSGRPSGKGFEPDSSLKPMADETQRLLNEAGIRNIEVVQLPYAFSEAQNIIKIKKSEAAVSGKKILFVLENIRMYSGEQSKDPAKRELFAKEIVALTQETTDSLIYMFEAFDKAHRADEASIEMGQLLFSKDHLAAGVKVADEAEKVLGFLSRVTGKLAVIAGGAKFDKLKNIADLGKRVGLSGGQLFIIGALANPVMADAGRNVGQSLMPTKPDDIKGFKDGQKKLIENVRDNKLKYALPVDFVVKNGLAIKETLDAADEQVDIGPKTTKQIVDYINSLQAGDGLLMNGGAGVFDKEWGSKQGTIAVVIAANEAAKRGVAVLCGGGDMFNAVNMVVRQTGIKLDPSVATSTAGGALFVAIAKGVGGGLIPVRAVMKFDGNVENKLLDIYDAIHEAFSGATVLSAVRTPYIDTSVNGDDATRQPALDLSRGADGERIALPDGRRAEIIKNFYETTFLPVIVTADDISAAMTSEQKDALANAKKEKDVTSFAQQNLRAVLANRGIPAQETQERSNALDPGMLGEVAVDISSLIAIRTRQGDLLIWVPVLIKRGQDAAHVTLNDKVNAGLENMQSKIAEISFSLPKDIVITSHNDAFKSLATYNPLFFDAFSKNDLSVANIVTDIINHLDPQAMVNPAANGIEFDKELGVFVSNKDTDGLATAPGFGKNLERFRGSLYAVGEICARLYQLITPNYDTQNKTGIAVKNKELQNAVIKFYAFMQRHLLETAIHYFNDARVFESLRVEVGDYAQRLNRAVRENDALELSRANADNIINHLTAKGVVLTSAEKDNIKTFLSNSGGLFDILQLSTLLSVDTFTQSFRYLKLDAPRKVMPSDQPFEAYDGSGRIARTQLAQRLASDINAQEAGYIGRYMVASQEVKGQTQEEKLNSAVEKAIEMLSDRQIEDAKILVRTAQGMEVLTDLIKGGRITFQAGNKVLAAQLDFQDTDMIPSVYSVNIRLDSNLVGVVYCVDFAQFKSGLQTALQARQRNLDNIPRPFIAYSESNEQIFFGLRVDATPGGVEIGDQELEAAGAKGKVKLSGDTLWKLFAKFNLPEPKGGKLGAADELARMRQIYTHVSQTRMPLEGGKQLIYDKAQIPKSMLLPGFNSLGRHLGWAIPFVGGADVMYVTPGSCSTNGASHAISALSVFSGAVDSVGPTFHQYTSSDKIVEKNPYGHTALKSTGAAKGVVLLLSLGEGGQTFFTAIRTPTGLINGKAEITGGSMFDLLTRLPNNIPDELIQRYLSRVASEFPEDLKFFKSEDQREGSYTWQDTIAGQKTGSILYADFIQRVAPGTYRIKVGYDNEMSFGSKENAMHEGAYLDALRNRQTAQLTTALSQALANTEAASSAVSASAVNEDTSAYVQELRDTFYQNIGNTPYVRDVISAVGLIIANKNKTQGSEEYRIYQRAMSYLRAMIESNNLGLMGVFLRAGLILGNDSNKEQYIKEAREIASSINEPMWNRAIAQFILVAINDETSVTYATNFEEVIKKYNVTDNIGKIALMALAVRNKYNQAYVDQLKRELLTLSKEDARRTEILVGLVAIANKDSLIISSGSSPLNPGNINSSANSASVAQKAVGGIDFRPAAMAIKYESMGNFTSLNPKLPILSKADLAVFDIDKELSGIEKLVNNQMIPSGERIKEVLAACSQKGELGVNKERLMTLLVKIGILEETQCCLQEASQEYKEVLVLTDSLA